MKQILFILIFLYAHPLFAQDFSAPATFATVNINSGFTPDPMTYDVISGGNIGAAKLGKSCAGNIANAPDFEFTFDAGLLDLYISVISSVDTTLVINAPNGNWICDDDSGGDLDPSIHFQNPSSGTYDVWIGTYNSVSTHDATLYISELGPYGN
ncbi:MAG: hypothetical protein ACJ0BT_00420 [Pseudohongiellaceae bacterium]